MTRVSDYLIDESRIVFAYMEGNDDDNYIIRVALDVMTEEGTLFAFEILCPSKDEGDKLLDTIKDAANESYLQRG
jgi:prefoldin subunit 5